MYPETKSNPHLMCDVEYRGDQQEAEDEPGQPDEVISNLVRDCLCFSVEDLDSEYQ